MRRAIAAREPELTLGRGGPIRTPIRYSKWAISPTTTSRRSSI
jgi:hypothetical protein